MTQGEYLAVMGNKPSNFSNDLTRPVEEIRWEDAVAYCDVLTKRERTEGRIPKNCIYRLPTEAEWEYASRAWTSTRFSFGDDPDYSELDNYAWFAANSERETHSVGLKQPNPWGLFDMHGNVSEWCHTFFGPYPGGSVLDPLGRMRGSYRSFRGGTWNYEGRHSRSAARNRDPDGENRGIIGFRVVLAPIKF